jgi:hypothetical protein
MLDARLLTSRQIEATPAHARLCGKRQKAHLAELREFLLGRIKNGGTKGMTRIRRMHERAASLGVRPPSLSLKGSASLQNSPRLRVTTRCATDPISQRRWRVRGIPPQVSCGGAEERESAELNQGGQTP